MLVLPAGWLSFCAVPDDNGAAAAAGPAPGRHGGQLPRRRERGAAPAGQAGRLDLDDQAVPHPAVGQRAVQLHVATQASRVEAGGKQPWPSDRRSSVSAGRPVHGGGVGHHRAPSVVRGGPEGDAASGEYLAAAVLTVLARGDTVLPGAPPRTPAGPEPPAWPVSSAGRIRCSRTRRVLTRR